MEITDALLIARLIQNGALIPVQVFGDADNNWGYGLCDRFSTHSPGGSDCNRAAFFLLRPSDEIMEDFRVWDQLTEVLEDPGESLWEPDERRGHIGKVDA